MQRSSTRIHAHVLILNGGLDDRTSPAQAQLLAEQVQRSGGTARAIIYPQYGHQIPVPVREAVIEPFIDSLLRAIAPH